MPNVIIHQEGGGTLASIFEEIRKRFEEVRRRAQEIFEKRQQHGSALDDWVQAEREILGSPAAEFSETSEGYCAEVALPGFDADDVSVAVTPNEIVVHATRKDEQERKEENVLWTEFGSREVYRRLETPTPIDTGKTTAVLEKGMLRIVAPKVTEQPAETAEAAV